MELRKEKQSFCTVQLLMHVFKIALLGVLVLSSLFALNRIKLSDYFPIKTVKVYGIQHVRQSEVQDLLLPIVDHGFFTINVEYIRDRLLQIPWIADVYVRRAWPDQIEITLIERSAVATWNNSSLLSTTGDLFSPRQETYSPLLPKLVGPVGKQIIVMRYFNDINRLLIPLHAKIAYLELTPYLTWKLRLDNGITLQMGHKDILTRLSHFVKVYPKIIGSRAADDVDYIDLRYSNGVAVRWKVSGA